MYDLVIVQCVKTKIWDKDDTALRLVPAKDAYVSPYFKKMRAFAEKYGKKWGVLSGKYGFLLPETKIENYNASFSQSSYANTASNPISLNKIKERLRADEDLRNGLGLNTIITCAVLGGDAYVKIAKKVLSEYQVEVIDLLKGLKFGEKLRWLGSKMGRGTQDKYLDMRRPSTEDKKLEAEFDRGMNVLCEEWKTECNYIATRYMQMVKKYGGFQTARKLLVSSKPQYGFTKLGKCGRSDLTVEALVTQEKYRSLFTDDEIEEAKRRLRELEYPI